MDAIANVATSSSQKSRHVGRRAQTTRGSDLLQQATRILDAARLVELGGRAGLVMYATGLEKKTANRLYRQLRGAPSPPGQSPFTDTWFLGSDIRMLHATIVWRLHRRLTNTGRGAAWMLITVYALYRCFVRQPVLDLTHAAFVPSLVDMDVWEERPCTYCGEFYLAPLESNDDQCPGCRLYHRYRCRQCGGPINARHRGRPRLTCGQCE